MSDRAPQGAERLTIEFAGDTPIYPSENGQWVRYNDHATALEAIRQAVLAEVERELLSEIKKLEGPNRPGEDFTAATARKIKAEEIRAALALLNDSVGVAADSSWSGSRPDPVRGGDSSATQGGDASGTDRVRRNREVGTHVAEAAPTEPSLSECPADFVGREGAASETSDGSVIWAKPIDRRVSVPFSRVSEPSQLSEEDRLEPHEETLAYMRAAEEIRQQTGTRWFRGAPSHVFAELARQLNDDGFALVRTQPGSGEGEECVELLSGDFEQALKRLEWLLTAANPGQTITARRCHVDRDGHYFAVTVEPYITGVQGQPNYGTEEKPECETCRDTRSVPCGCASHRPDCTVRCPDCGEKPVESGEGETNWENVYTVTEQLDGSVKISPRRDGFALMYLVPKREADALLRQATVERNDGLALAAEFQAKYAALKAAEGEGSR